MLLPHPVVHGVYVLCYLSRQEPKVVVPAKAVASSMGVPPEQASKILQALAAAGLVTAYRGRQGGYSLVRPLETITLADVFVAIADSQDEARLRSRRCPLGSREMCSAHSGLKRIHEEFWGLLRRESLSSLIGRPCSSKRRLPVNQAW